MGVFCEGTVARVLGEDVVQDRVKNEISNKQKRLYVGTFAVMS